MSLFLTNLVVLGMPIAISAVIWFGLPWIGPRPPHSRGLWDPNNWDDSCTPKEKTP